MEPTYEEIAALIASEAAETSSLEFKDGDALGRGNGRDTEMIKDISAMANAAGGRIIYGLSEKKTNTGECVAAGFAPVSDAAATSDWVHQVIASNTSPPLIDFRVSVLGVPGAANGERIVVVDVDEAATAHQSTRDRRYYQRMGATASPMLDFQVRDVMARRNKPRIAVELRHTVTDRGSNRVLMRVSPALTNEGNLSISRWSLCVGLPEDAVDRSPRAEPVGRPIERPDGSARFKGYACFDFSTSMSHMRHHGIGDLHPGTTLALDGRIGISPLCLMVNPEIYALLERKRRPPILWTLYMADAQPLEGQMPFETWCNY